MSIEAKVKKLDEERQVVYGEVYPPDIPDSDMDYMTRDQIIDMAHRFMINGILKNIDTQHDNNLNGSVVVESWVEQNKGGIFIEGAWVVGVHIPDENLWAQVVSGEINGFSLEAYVERVPRIVEIELPDVLEGDTFEAEGHTHRYFVRYDENGNYLGGETDVVNGHKHSIRRGTATERSQGHSHRYSTAQHFNGLDVVSR